MNAPARTASRHPDYVRLAAQIAAAPMATAPQVVVDAPFEQPVAMALLFVGFICLYLVDDAQEKVCLAAMSTTEQSRLAVEQYNFEPTRYQLALDADQQNTIVAAVVANESRGTRDWATLGRAGVNAEVVRLNQANSGIAYTAVYPLRSASGRGALMYNYYQYQDQLGNSQRSFMERYTQLVADTFTAWPVVQQPLQ